MRQFVLEPPPHPPPSPAPHPPNSPLPPLIDTHTPFFSSPKSFPFFLFFPRSLNSESLLQKVDKRRAGLITLSSSNLILIFRPSEREEGGSGGPGRGGESLSKAKNEDETR